MPKLNGALITLLPKKEAVDLPSDYRPIRLVHSFAKLISKVSAMRIAPHINTLVSNSQNAFIKGRCIQENFLFVRGFLVRLRNWLVLILSSSSSSVRMNGVQGPWIKHKHGLRQGDPLSLYLFILAIDTLQFILQRKTEEGLLTPLRDRVAHVRLSLYADDATLFINPTKNYVDNIVAIMTRFGNATALCMNMAKSAALTIRRDQLNI
jgi:hypothetical protein